MATTQVPERLRWAVELLNVQPEDVVLEIGCGGGVAVHLVCERLAGGTILAIDRSATMIDRAQRRNANCIAAGKATFRVAPLESVDLADACFTKIFAVNVNVFWARDAGAELAAIRRALAPGGRVFLCYEPPTAARAHQAARTVVAALDRAGFAPTTVTGGTDGRLLCVSGEPRGDPTTPTTPSTGRRARSRTAGPRQGRRRP